MAAAGGHNLLMIGPPGSGKRCWPDVAGHLAAIEAKTRRWRPVASTASSGSWPRDQPLLRRRPFRFRTSISRPVSSAAARCRVPGEVSLAHNGVLFLDEAGELVAQPLMR